MNYDFSELNKIFSAISEEEIESLIESIKAHGRIFLHGAGRSGLMMKALTMRLAQGGKIVYSVGEVVTPAIAEGDLLILASASGKTAGVCHAAKIARSVGADVYALTATEESELATLSDAYLILSAPSKDSGGSDSIMGSLFEEALLLLGDCLAKRLFDDTDAMRRRHANIE